MCSAPARARRSAARPTTARAAQSICGSRRSRVEQPRAAMSDELAEDIIEGAYWMREPGPNAEVIVAYSGVIAPQAIAAVGLMAEDRRDVGLLASPPPTGSTLAGRRPAGRASVGRAKARATSSGCWPLPRRTAGSSPCSTATPRRSPGSARCAASRTRALGVEHFGQTGTVADALSPSPHRRPVDRGGRSGARPSAADQEPQFRVIGARAPIASEAVRAR